MFYEILSQISAPQPDSLVTLQWIIITALASTVALLYRENRKREKEKIKILEKVLDGLSESSEASKGLAVAFEAFREQLSILEAIDNLREEFRHDTN